MKRLINLRLGLFIALSIALGIASAIFFYIKSYVTGSIFCGAFFIFGLLYLIYSFKRKTGKECVIILLILSLFFAVGFLSTHFRISAYENERAIKGSVEITAKVKEIKDTDYGGAILLENVEFVGSANTKTDYKIYLSVYGACDLDMGDVIKFNAELTARSLIYEGNFSGENLSSKIKYDAFVYAQDVVKVKSEKNIFQIINCFIRETLKSGMADDAFALSYALVAGNSDFIDQNTIENFRYAGIAHIFAVSGLHVGIFAVALSFVLKKCRVKPLVRIAVVFLVTLFYSGVCGFSSSAIRATIMYSVGALNDRYMVKHDGLTPLGISATIILLINPIQLFCVGFLLSFGVVFGILLLSKPLCKIFKFLPNKLSRSASSVIAAQLSSLPICLFFFGQTSLIAVAFNLLIIPFVSIIYIYLIISILLAGITGLYGAFLFLPELIFTVMRTIINAVDYHLFIVGGFTFGIFAFLYYGVFVCASGILNFKAVTKTVLCVSMALICIVGTVCSAVIDAKKIKTYICGTASVNFVVASYGGQNTLIVSDVGERLNMSPFKKLNQKYRVKKLDRVIINGCDMGLDFYHLTIALCSVFEVREVYYYGIPDENKEKMLGDLFPKVNCNALTAGRLISFNNGYFKYTDGGFGIEVGILDKAFKFFGEFNNEINNLTANDRVFDMIVADDYTDSVFALCRTNVKRTYRKSGFINGEEHGFLMESF